ncbi:hypothetical protein BU23DRAFT_445525 [Bimuria novae-zelandiae CBS 107.79]|uniref:BTB domain-containing protein n=1 Tax=Bimuria novae-zelandiae CBS 107.79 TaxID=1447943 RepID=A0A6A5VQD9_9PLEO|nr:hypothetical protein BU23DRAFT_445525 [Bimuria novae-zelandiae CBS 107.79]
MKDYPGTYELLLDQCNFEYGLLHRMCGSASVVAEYDDNSPVYFSASSALAVCWHSQSACPKVCVQLPECQVDLFFELSEDANAFVNSLKNSPNNSSTLYEAPSKQAYLRSDFKLSRYIKFDGMNPTKMSDNPVLELTTRLWGSGDFSDFTVKAGDKAFPVHKPVICVRSDYFKNACESGFAESVDSSIKLEESPLVIEALLMELYGVKNHLTGSLFTSFAVGQYNIKKETVMTTLLEVFIAADKYDLPAIKTRVAYAFVDRLHIYDDPLVLLDLAVYILEHFPERDLGLRNSVLRYVQTRLPDIFDNKDAKEMLAGSAELIMALLGNFSAMVREGSLVFESKASSGLLTPPDSPMAPAKRRRL